MKKLLRFVFFLALAVLIVLAFSIPHSSKNIRVARSAEEIYEGADYLAHIDLTREGLIFELKSNKFFLSGILIQHKNRYYILTAGHIVSKDPNVVIQEIRVSFKGQPGVYSANVYKINRKIDCALLKIEKMADSDFIFTGRLSQFGFSKNLKIGEPVYSLGSPLNFKFTLGSGIIKNLGVHTDLWDSVILLKADLASGSSGGPLINKYGEVIGMNVGMLSNYQNFNFAIGIDEIRDWLATIESPAD